jgi:hypothetical protein
MYQIEVKRHLVEHLFPPSEGSDVRVDLDPMERANGGQHDPGKREIAENCKAWFVAAGVEIRLPKHGEERPDLVAVHPSEGTFVAEVEGESSREPGVSVDSALAQVLRRMPEMEDRVVRVVAVPDSSRWKRQLSKIAPWVISRVNLQLFLVSAEEARQFVTDNTAYE